MPPRERPGLIDFACQSVVAAKSFMQERERSREVWPERLEGCEETGGTRLCGILLMGMLGTE